MKQGQHGWVIYQSYFLSQQRISLILASVTKSCCDLSNLLQPSHCSSLFLSDRLGSGLEVHLRLLSTCLFVLCKALEIGHPLWSFQHWSASSLSPPTVFASMKTSSSLKLLSSSVSFFSGAVAVVVALETVDISRSMTEVRKGAMVFATRCR